MITARSRCGRSRAVPLAHVPALLAPLLAIAVAGCGGDSDAVTAAPIEDTLARERAAAYFYADSIARARRAVAPLVPPARRDAALEDLARAAVIEFAAVEYETAETFLARIEAEDPDYPALLYIRGRMAVNEGDFEAALGWFEKAHELYPDDLPTTHCLATVLYDLDEAPERAEALWSSTLDVGLQHGGAWYVTAVYCLSRVALMAGDAEKTQRYQTLWQSLKDKGLNAASVTLIDRGNFARILPPQPTGTVVPAGPTPPVYVAEAPILLEMAGASELFLTDVNGDRATDIVTSGPGGLRVALRADDGYAAPILLFGGPVALVLALDLGDDDDLDFVVASGAQLVLVTAEEVAAESPELRWAPAALALPAFPSPPRDGAPVDFDHDGDLDLLFVGDFGVRLLRNDGAALEGGAFTDVTTDAGLPTDVAFAWCITEDFDSDQDVDFLLGGPGALFLADNLRAGHFADITAAVFGPGAELPTEPVAADLDGDARTDLLALGPESVLWRRTAEGVFGKEPSALSAPVNPHAILVDIDLDGSADVFWTDAERLASGALAPGLEVETPCTLGDDAPGKGPIAFADLDRDLDVDVVRVTEAGVEIFRCQGATGGGAVLQWFGFKDNRRAVGAVVELRAREIYRRIYWRGDPVVVGVGEAEYVDVVRITWPNGIVQTVLDTELGYQPFLGDDFGAFGQSPGLTSSCPFLYSWDGSTYTFVTDVLGITPLGLPMAPGVLVPPDHDEFVLVRGDQLVPKDGLLELHLTEELREVTYLDFVRLDAVDHPIGTEIFPNERFTFPPFPEPHTFTVESPRALVSAMGSDGRDWTDALARTDEVRAAPFEPLTGQLVGLATPHWLELEFDREGLADAHSLHLVFTGWFFWTDASVNVASARTPGVDFVPPTLQVPTADGGWRAAGPPVGFPAGKSKSMVIDVTDILARDDPRLRVASTLRLYWDSIRLAVDEDPSRNRTSALAPTSAHLWPRGFSAPIADERPNQPERFDWDLLATHPRWNQHPGLYTRYGETLPLLDAIDDRFVILGAGDALTLTFDATALPPLADGFVRDYLLFLDGWAKDRDPNTIEALRVEPLPFHGMSGYPYGADEHFPSDQEHEVWRTEWNTRPAFEWIVPLSPTREAEWARGL